MEASINSVVGAFVSLGPGGIFCIPLMGWIYLLSRDNKQLREKVLEVAVTSATATANSAAASNRLADMLNVRRTPE